MALQIKIFEGCPLRHIDIYVASVHVKATNDVLHS